jgi:hypothetical protein
MTRLDKTRHAMTRQDKAADKRQGSRHKTRQQTEDKAADKRQGSRQKKKQQTNARQGQTRTYLVVGGWCGSTR